MMAGRLGRLFRYGVVGVAVNAGGYMVYLLVTWLGVGPKTTAALLYALGATMGYLGNRRFTFAQEGKHAGAILRFALAHLGGFALNLTLLYVFFDRLGYSHRLVQGAAILVVAAMLFVAFEVFVFPRGDRQGDRPNPG